MISYYKIEDVENGRLRCPSSLPELASLDISPEYLDKTHFRNPPKVEIGVDGLPRYRGEADIEDNSPTMLSAPLSSGVPLLKSVNDVGSPSKRGKRFDPYSTGTAKRLRKNKNSPNQTSSTAEQLPQPLGNLTQQQPVYTEPSSANMTHPHYSSYGAPSYYQMPTYPPPHAYSSASYSNQASPSPSNVPQQPSPTPPAPQHSVYTYTPPATGGVEAQPAQQPYQYQYYPPPPHNYAYPPNVAWPYPGYSTQQAAQQPVNNVGVTAAATGLGDKSTVNQHDPEGVENGQTSP